MSNTRTAWIFRLAMVTALVLPLRSDAESNAIHSISIEFSNSPIELVAQHLAMLTEKPIVVRVGVHGIINYQSQGVTSEQAMKEVQAKLQKQDMLFTNVNDTYYKLVRAAETNDVGESPHIMIEVRGDMITMDGRLFPLESLAETVTGSLTPGTEVWVHDDRGDVIVTLQNYLRPKFQWNKLYQVYLPRKKGG